MKNTTQNILRQLAHFAETETIYNIQDEEKKNPQQINHKNFLFRKGFGFFSFTFLFFCIKYVLISSPSTLAILENICLTHIQEKKITEK